ncbi:hypothetical protein Xoosp13_58 [Xanthomonas phage Xoo-sp13]|nr:hypothetical protein Xoosp13_58 [Xanthomonas phage Xoo-sp13]
MNLDLESARLDDIQLDAVSGEVSISLVPQEAATTTVTEVQTVTAVEPETVSPAVSPRSRAGRKVDTTGSTNLGKARILYAANSSFSPKQLKQLFEAELGIKASVAQAYASIVRSKAKAVG